MADEKFRYYVVWLNFQLTQFGAGHDLIEREQPIETYDEIMELRELVQKKHNLTDVQILDWKRID